MRRRDCLGDMARHSIDERSADRLLSGAVDPDDAPPGYEQVARLVRVSQSPAGSAELAREQAIASSAAAAVLGAGQALISPGQPHRRRNKVISKLGAARAAAITVAAVLGAGAAAAAATGNLPSQGSSHPNDNLTVSGAGTTGSNSGTGGNGSNQGNPNPNQANPLKLPTTGPANFHAVIGLCRAFLAHNPTTGTSGGATTPPEDNSTAFQALIKDATGMSTGGSLSATATWCTNYLKNYSPGQSGSAPNHNSSSNNANNNPGKPTSPGNSGSHQGGGSGGNGTSNSVHGDGLTQSSTGNGAGGGAGSAGSGGAGRH